MFFSTICLKSNKNPAVWLFIICRDLLVTTVTDGRKKYVTVMPEQGICVYDPILEQLEQALCSKRERLFVKVPEMKQAYTWKGDSTAGWIDQGVGNYWKLIFLCIKLDFKGLCTNF